MTVKPAMKIIMNTISMYTEDEIGTGGSDVYGGVEVVFIWYCCTTWCIEYIIPAKPMIRIAAPIPKRTILLSIVVNLPAIMTLFIIFVLDAGVFTSRSSFAAKIIVHNAKKIICSASSATLRISVGKATPMIFCGNRKRSQRKINAILRPVAKE
jgi:hypothetical protein